MSVGYVTFFSYKIQQKIENDLFICKKAPVFTGALLHNLMSQGDGSFDSSFCSVSQENRPCDSLGSGI